jgi:hypothetical protein
VHAGARCWAAPALLSSLVQPSPVSLGGGLVTGPATDALALDNRTGLVLLQEPLAMQARKRLGANAMETILYPVTLLLD